MQDIEIFEGRFQATKDEIVTVCDNYLKMRDFDGIDFMEFPILDDANKRTYYGTRIDDTTRQYVTPTLGYVEITQINRLNPIGVRVRIVCVWPALITYWEELSQTLQGLYPLLLNTARVVNKKGEQIIDLTAKKAGRTSDPVYDRAFSRLQKGETDTDVFEWYCQQEKILYPEGYDRRRFKSAMKRRFNKTQH